jgi:hypothetical protein
MMATKSVAVLEQLNTALQAKSANVSGMVEAVTKSSKYINSLRTEEAFHEIFSVAEAKCHKYSSMTSEFRAKEDHQEDTQVKQQLIKLKAWKSTIGRPTSNS